MAARDTASDGPSSPVAGTPSRSEIEPTISLLPAELIDAEKEEDRRSAKRLQLFMGTRLGVATLLLGGTLLIALEDQRGFDSFTPAFLVTLIASIYGASLVFAVWLLGSRNRDRVALAQVGTDLLVTTGLVYVTGGPGSGFTFLYGVAVLMAAMVVGPLAARVTGGAAIALYFLLAVSLARGWVPPPPDQPTDAYVLSITELAYASLLNVLGLLLVTLLAGNLSARLLTAGGQLRLAEASAATLARVNEDIVRSLSAGLLSTDPEGRIRTINPTGLEMLGGDADAILGHDVREVLDLDLGPMLRSENLAHAAVNRAEGGARRLDGTRFPIGYSVNQLLNTESEPIGALVLFQDLSEIARLREVAARQERLAVLGRLSAGLAHEIRNPLSSISGAVQMVREARELDAEDRRLLGIVLEEVERLDDMVTTMLQVGKPRSPQRSEHDLRVTVTGVVEMAQRGPAAAKGVTLQRELPDDAVTAFVDADQVRQVVWNLVKNALQASPHGSLVRVAARIGEDESAVLEVSDEGAGIDPSQMDKVYNMFYSERTHGAGIGLALVRQIVDAHGGAIEIRSGRARGATFVVTFPSRLQSPRSRPPDGNQTSSDPPA